MDWWQKDKAPSESEDQDEATGKTTPEVAKWYSKDTEAPVEAKAEEPASGFLAGVKHGLKTAGAAAVHGVNAVLGLPGDVDELANRTLPNALTRPLGSPAGTTPVNPFYTSGDYNKVTDSWGLTGSPDAQPQGALERLEAGGVTGAVAALPALATGGSALPTVLSGAGGGVAAAGSHELFPNSPGLEIAAGALGGLGVQGIAHALQPEPFEAIARGLGASTSLEQAGNVAQNSARNWLANVMPQRLQQTFAPADALIPAGVSTPIPNFTRALQGAVTNAGQAAPIVNQLKSLLPNRMLHALNYNTVAGLGGNFTWDEVNAIRRQVGDAMANPSAHPDIGEQELSRLYGALSDDMRSTARGISPEAGAAWDNGNAAAQAIYRTAGGPMSRLVKAARPTESDPRPGFAASTLFSGAKKDSTDLATLRQEMPAAVDELAAAHLRQNGAKGWSGLTPESKSVLVTNPQVRAQLDAAVGNRPLQPGMHAGLVGLGATAGELVGHDYATVIGHLVGAAENSLIPGALGGIVGSALLGASPYARGMAMAMVRHPAGALAGGLAGNALGGVPDLQPSPDLGP